MKRIFLGLMTIVLIAGCGGGSSENNYTVVLPTPLHEALEGVADSLTMGLGLRGGESVGQAIVASADGSLNEDYAGYTFELIKVPGLGSDPAMVEIDFALPADLQLAKDEDAVRVTVARLVVPFEASDDIIVLSVTDDDYDFLIDDDGDGVPNLAEFAANLNPLVADTDGDGVLDGEDVCSLIADADQADADGDGVGNVCDGDYVAPSVSTIPVPDVDRDDDGAENDDDNCPDASNPDQADIDQDGNGDVCDNDIDGDGVVNEDDNCTYVANPGQSETDADGDGAFDDCDLDATDPKVGTAQDGVFVDIAHGDDTSFGTRDHPLATLGAGIIKARAEGKAVYVAAGVYPLDDVTFHDGVNIFGGFKNTEDAAERFTARDVRSTDAAFRTQLSNDDEDITLHLEGVQLTVSGFHLSNAAQEVSETFGARTIVAGNGAEIVLERNTIQGNTTALMSTGVRAEYGGTLVLERNRIDGGGYDVSNSTSVGVAVENAQARLLNNIVTGGSARFVNALSVEDASPLVVNNTFDASGGTAALGGSEGVRLHYANPVFVNNLILTSNAKTQYVLTCYGEINETAIFNNNLFAAFPGDAGHPLVVDCDGVGNITAGQVAGMSLGSASVSGNLVYDASNDPLNLVRRTSDYALVGGGINDGLDASIEEYGSVTDDFNGTERAGAYDIGAVEN